MKNIKFYTTILVLALVAVLSSCSSSGNSPGDTVTTLFKHVENKDYAAAAALYIGNNDKKLSEEEAKKIEGLLGMAAAEYEKKDGLDKVTIDEEIIEEDGNSAKVKITIHYKNGDTEKDTVRLSKVDGQWFARIN